MAVLQRTPMTFLALTVMWIAVTAEIVFNLAEDKKIRATATCGVYEDAGGYKTYKPEGYCHIGAGFCTNEDSDNNTTENNDYYTDSLKNEVLQNASFEVPGHACDICDAENPDKSHPAEHAIDGSEKWWQSPPLSRDTKFNEVNLTIDLGQEYHVVYVFIRMANSPRPGVWALERSKDYGKTYQPWQYFAGDSNECMDYFNVHEQNDITADDSVLCVTEHSKVIPFCGGEIMVTLLNDRPSAKDFYNSPVLQNWIKATNIRLRLLHTKTWNAHLMSDPKDPTVTSRYFYSIKDISIGGKCVCNGHANYCPKTGLNGGHRCECLHNTCGFKCEKCCEGFVQKAWRPSTTNDPFICEKCNCFGHSDECEYNADVDKSKLSLDMHGVYNGGGVCKNCKHNTVGFNCNKCKAGFYRPSGRDLHATNVCESCNCSLRNTTGNCRDGTGQCECKPEYLPPSCDSCSPGYYGYPNCQPCKCHWNQTQKKSCKDGWCICKTNYAGKLCDSCADGYYNFPYCKSCSCNSEGSISYNCDKETGNCKCKGQIEGQICNKCKNGHYNFPKCTSCSCDRRGTQPEICDKRTGKCICKSRYKGKRCEQCSDGKYSYPKCLPCNCSMPGSTSQTCSFSGRCTCHSNYDGKKCEKCNFGYYKYPDCLDCKCNLNGSRTIACNNEGKCQCEKNFAGIYCDKCEQGFFNFPKCEACNCDSKGVTDPNSSCESQNAGESCQCKKNVKGRTCNECKPHYWNISASNPNGCEDCKCNLNGVIAGIGECNSINGQCNCKLLVESHNCELCKIGSYNLNETNILGCSDCGCDVGGSLNNNCHSKTGQCVCKPHIEGRTCDVPIDGYYFPTLYQFQFEAEDGRTPDNKSIHYEFNQSVFPNFSWKGYAVFSKLQKELIIDFEVKKYSIYHMIFSYVNLNSNSISASITLMPNNNKFLYKTFQILFAPSSAPSFITLSDYENTGNNPYDINIDPGKWSVRIENDGNLFLDYLAIIPSEYYKANILTARVNTPCAEEKYEKRKHIICRHFDFPKVSKFDMVKGKSLAKEKTKPFNIFGNLGRENAMENNKQELQLSLRTSKFGQHALVIIYSTSREDGPPTKLNLDVFSGTGTESGKVILYTCIHVSFCRQVVQDTHEKIGIFNFTTKHINLLVKWNGEADIVIHSFVAIPHEKWSFGYIEPKSVCVKRDGKCLTTSFMIPPDSRKVEFESEIKTMKSLAVGTSDKSVGLIYFDIKDEMIGVKGKVLYKGDYVFIVHYYQPDYPGFILEVVLENGQLHEVRLQVNHCPSHNGCRSVVQNLNGNIKFGLNKKFALTLKKKDDKTMWLGYVLIIPADSYRDDMLYEEEVSLATIFIDQCGKKEFYMESNSQGFCRDAVFSLTSNYNNGTLPCQCDSDGSVSSTCEKFGGQCPCKANIIGRKCEQCKIGFYGFPKCLPCKCPENLLCDSRTGTCLCPPRVTGERCDECEKFHYGYDKTIGCKPCNCHARGVKERDFQCDLHTGLCNCKENVSGRTCDHCSPGFSSFPYCNPCRCDLRGTEPKICDENSSNCLCKKHVVGKTCDMCAEGTFNLEENNPDGCTKCFCFGQTKNCTSSSLYKSKVSSMKKWTFAERKFEGSTLIMKPINMLPNVSGNAVYANLTSEEIAEKIIYLGAPKSYLGNKLTSYGGFLNYTISYSSRGYSDSTGIEADVILHGSSVYLLHYQKKQSMPQKSHKVSLLIMESNFKLMNGSSATRENMLGVLKNLDGLYLRATTTKHLMLESVVLEIAEEFGIEKALAVEQCSCPEKFLGLSCEKCAPGYFRSNIGSQVGECIPCQCNSHAQMCDPDTGVCLDCKHETTGVNCEKCEKGYYGNATQGTSRDCKKCPCPLDIISNSFATECEVSPDGKSIVCLDCLPQYIGKQCESCAPGFFGNPKRRSDNCKPCNCSGNINSNEPGSCDPISGDCLKCQNNTYGKYCSECAPGYFGDAVNLKNCKKCKCNECGTKECNTHVIHKTELCKCKENVKGDKCNKCAANHWNFSSCMGCIPCDCQLASKSMQCNEKTGQCICQPGVTGLTCNQCRDGFWNYSSEGCIPCECNTSYSEEPFLCDVNTGQCKCLKNVTGTKCDQCPSRWVLIEDEDCNECDICIHILLNDTDLLAETIERVITDINNTAVNCLTIQRLNYITNRADELYSKVKTLIPKPHDTTDIESQIDDLKEDSRKAEKMASFVLERGLKAMQDGNGIYAETLIVQKTVNKDIEQTTNIIVEMCGLTFNIIEHGSKVETMLEEAQDILNQTQNMNFRLDEEATKKELKKAQDYLTRSQEVSCEVTKHSIEFEEIHNKLIITVKKLEDLNTQNDIANKNIEAAQKLITHNRLRLPQLKQNIETVMNLSKEMNSASLYGKEYLENATNIWKNIDFNNEKLKEKEKDLKNLAHGIQTLIKTNKEAQKDTENLAQMAADHAENLRVRAEKLNDLFSDTRNASEKAVQAATANKNIADAINEAKKAAKDAEVTAEKTLTKSTDFRNITGKSRERSAKLWNDSKNTLINQTSLKAKLKDTKIKIRALGDLNKVIDNAEKCFNSTVKHIPSELVKSAVENSSELGEKASNISIVVLNNISNIAERAKEDIKEARNVTKVIGNTNIAISQATVQVEKVKQHFPEVLKLTQQVGKQQSDFKAHLTDIKQKIEELTKSITEAKDKINSVSIGVKFYGNSTLQLKNPEGLSNLGVSSTISAFFRTNSTNGFLLYLGNEVGSSKRLKRVISDDFLALEIENGFPILKMNLGSSPQVLASEKKVNFHTWYQVIIERVGNHAKLIIREEDESKKEHLYEAEMDFPETYTILNLDQDLSKLFIGGYPEEFEMQKSVNKPPFVGEVEGLFIGGAPVSLWNYEQAENVKAAKEREKLIDLHQKTGFRFNGNGFIIMKMSAYQMKQKCNIRLKFKTYRKDGLIFLVAKDNSFLSVELVNGILIYQFNLGDGTVLLKSEQTYDDGEWHSVEATRQKKDAVLLVDGENVGTASSTGTATNLVVTDLLYFGGYYGEHNLTSITKLGFDGCIDDVYIGNTPIDLNEYNKTFGIVPGCPKETVSLVSFTGNSRGSIRWPHLHAKKALQLIFKLNTTQKDALLFFVTDKFQSHIVSLSLVNGELIMYGPKEGVRISTAKTIANKYNDGEWHVVTATYNQDIMLLNIDDIDSFTSEKHAMPLSIEDGDMYFGGVPNELMFKANLESDHIPFFGCLRDVFINGKIVNFANLTSNPYIILGQCNTTKLEHKAQGEIVELRVPQTLYASQSDTRRLFPSTSAANPVVPDANGFKFGKSPSFLLYTEGSMPIKPRSNNISLEFRTKEKNGIIFYTANRNHTDINYLFMKDGKVIYAYACGSTTGLIKTKETWNDGEWHSVTFSRSESKGKLEVDHSTVKGDSTCRRMKISYPFFIGGIDNYSTIHTHYIHMDLNNSFKGCLRNLHISGQKIIQHQVAKNVIPCQDIVEPEIFFPASGGYIIIEDNYEVGINITIEMDIKPRKLNGIINSVHGRKDYLILQMFNGKLLFTVNNGIGDFTAEYQPSNKSQLLDGNWHRIKAIKNKNVAALMVDHEVPVIKKGKYGSSSTDTTGPLYLGGHGRINSRIIGLKSREPFYGCVRKMLVNGKTVDLVDKTNMGNVTIGGCPIS